MGKTPKKAAPGGDERNLYVRRLKAASETQRESENNTRTKLTGVRTNLSTAGAKNFKSKLRSPAKPSTSRLPKYCSKQASVKEQGKPRGLSSRTLKICALTMQSKPEELESQSVGKEEVVEQNAGETEKMPEAENAKLKPEEQPEAGDEQKEAEEKPVDAAPLEMTSETTSQGKEEQAMEGSVEKEEDKETEECEVKLSFCLEDSPKKIQNQEESNGYKEDKEEGENESEAPRSLQKDVIEEKEDLQSEAQTDTESYSIDVVESTTSEMSEASEPVAQTDVEKLKEKPSQLVNDDASFISFDSSIMLKDAQVKLNDCLKDNSQLFDISTADRSVSEPGCKDASFGRTLRNISGRHSLSRMRHVTLRNRLLSPDSSLYVNTSSASLPGDETLDCKVLRHRTGLSDSFARNNGTPGDRKRKLEPESTNEAKKLRSESQDSLLDSSLGMLKGLRIPIQVSTPNVGKYRLKPDLLNISNDDKMSNAEQSANSKKWCSIM